MDDKHKQAEQEESIKNLMLAASVGLEEARRLYAVLECNDWCVLQSGGDLVIAPTSDLKQPDVGRFPGWPSLIAWLQQQMEKATNDSH